MLTGVSLPGGPVLSAPPCGALTGGASVLNAETVRCYFAALYAPCQKNPTAADIPRIPVLCFSLFFFFSIPAGRRGRAASQSYPCGAREGCGSCREMRRGRGDGGGGVAALLWCVCVMALAGAAAAQGPRLTSAYKTLSGKPRSCSPSATFGRARACVSSTLLRLRAPLFICGRCLRVADWLPRARGR